MLRVTPAGSKTGMICEVKAVVDVMYTWVDDVQVKEVTDRLKQFIEIHASFSAWPYWRELAASALNRMSLPAVTMPMITQADIVAHFSGKKTFPVIHLSDEAVEGVFKDAEQDDQENGHTAPVPSARDGEGR